MDNPQTLPDPRSTAWWSIRLYYFIYIGGSGFLWPFLALFYARQGLSGTQIGVLGSIGALIALIAAPLWGRWSDRAVGPHRLLQLSFFASMISMLIVSQQTVFLIIALLIGLNEFATAGSDPLSTVLALKPGKGSKNTGFGSIRLWGSLGWAIVVFSSGWVIERTGIFSAFLGYAVAMAASILLLGMMVSQRNRNTKPGALIRHNPQELLRHLLRRPMLLGLAAALMVSWISRLGVGQFEPLYMESLGAGETIIGLASSIGAVVELPAMIWADQLIKKFGSWAMLQMTFGLYAVMALGILILPSIPMILMTRLLGGVAYSLVTVSLVIFLNDNAPLGQSATMLALYTITFRNLVVLVAAPLGGQIYDAVGAYWLYLFAFIGSLISLAILRITQTTKLIKGEKYV